MVLLKWWGDGGGGVSFVFLVLVFVFLWAVGDFEVSETGSFLQIYGLEWKEGGADYIFV